MTCPSTKEDIRRIVLDAGACRVGFAAAGPVGDSTRRRYDSWIAGGRHAGMAYLGRYGDVRSDPRLLLDGAATVISCAFDYRPSRRHPLFADYSLGEDYHDVLRSRLTAAAEVICSRYGGLTRICVDTAPIRERYWAARAGVGVIGLNGLIIVDGIGSKVFLAEILWTGKVGPDLSRLADICMNCGACVRACPGRALGGDMTLDARSCNSYLTIEHRGDLPAGLSLDGRIYGCDICQDVCPHNRAAGSTAIAEFAPSDALMALDIDALRGLDAGAYRSLFRHSAVRRAKLPQLLRNAKSRK